MKAIIALLLMVASCEAATVLSASGNISMSGNISFEATAPPGDTTAPSISSASVAANGTDMSVWFSESVTNDATTTGFYRVAGGNSDAMTYVSGAGSNRVEFTCPIVYIGQSVTLNYSSANHWFDISTNSNILPTTSGVSVTNNSTQGGSSPVWAAYFNEAEDYDGGLVEVTDLDDAMKPGSTAYFGGCLSVSNNLHVNWSYADSPYTNTANDVWLRFKFVCNALTNYEFVILQTAAEAVQCQALFGDSGLRIHHGTVYSSWIPVTVGITNWCWLHYNRSGGTLDAFLSSTSTRPVATNIVLTAGNGTTQAEEVRIGGSPNSRMYWDNVEIFTSDPE